jgi:hypothetical protein
VKRRALARHSKPMFTCLPDSSHDVPTTALDTIIVSKIGPMIDVGLLEFMVIRQKAKPVSQVSAA